MVTVVCLTGVQAPPGCGSAVETSLAVLCNLTKRSFPAGKSFLKPINCINTFLFKKKPQQHSKDQQDTNMNKLGWNVAKLRCCLIYILGQLFQQMGGLDVCLSFLKTCPSVDLKLQACQLMCNLSCNPAISTKCSDNQLIPVMIGVLQDYFKALY